MPRYNLALLPQIHSLQCIHHAAHFQGIGTDYLLGKQSLPHITVAQFRTDDTSLLDTIWQDILHQSLHSFEFKLHLTGTHWIYDFKRNDYIWLQLMPGETSALHDLHKKIIALLHQHHLNPINRALDNYEPHLTLAHTSNLSHLEKLQHYQFAITDTFHLALGESDEIGQLVKIIKKI